MADAEDLKSSGDFSSCGFDSHPGHHLLHFVLNQLTRSNNYPAGSLLRVRDAKRVFAAREFEGAPSLAGQKHTFLVLDGQQRLTSLYQAFYGVGEHRYYLNLN